MNMNEITFPLGPEMRGSDVTNLQNALLLFLDLSIFLQGDEDTKKYLSDAVKSENNKQTYYKATHELVKIFQEEQKLKVSGNVDKATASVINATLRKIGLLDEQKKVTSIGTFDKKYTVICQVIDLQDNPIIGLQVQAFDHDPISPHEPLGEMLTTNDGGIANIHFRQSDLTEHPEGEGPNIYFKVYRKNTLLEYTLPKDENDNGVLQGFKTQHDPITIQIEKHHVVKGYIVLENGVPAQNLELLIYNREFGEKDGLLIDKTKTNNKGHYTLTYNPDGEIHNLDVRIRDPKDPQKEIPLAKTRFNASSYEVLNLVAPALSLQSEYQRLKMDLKSHVSDMNKLTDVVENTEQRDLTILNRATGWDARLIALASVAAKLNAESDIGLSQEVLYGLFRVGLPFDKHQLAQVSVEAVDLALKKGREAGIIDLSDSQLKNAKEQFETFSLNTRLEIPAPGSQSTYNDLLNSVNLDKKTRDKFASLFLKHRGDAAQLWEEAANNNIESEDIKVLQLQGKLAFLTRNSKTMTNLLQEKMEVSDPVELVEQSYYKPEIWKAKINDLAGIEELIPLAYEAENVDDRLNAYAEDMARKVRLSYPTQVIRHMIEQDEDDELFKLGSARLATAALLKKAVTLGFRFGQTPVEAFLRDHHDKLNDIDTNEFESAKQGMKTLQCVYQLTPDNESMIVLLNSGLTSAYDVGAFSQKEFLKSYGHKFPSLEQAKLIHRKAEQVSNVTHNLLTIFKKLDSDVTIYGMSAPEEVRENTKKELIKQFPTLESLFGSMDFCECEHCRSVLSPAAYLVDLLQFIDDEKKPYDVLIERRPDIPHIPLTCENTNIALPYIDVVNEILEYYVANNKELDEKAAYDTGNATTEELMAEPQNVITKAYDELQKARYPLNLPFDLWIDTVRQFCNHFETPLWKLLEVFRKGDELSVHTQPYDWEAIFIESLGMSPAEYAIFTDQDPLDEWYEPDPHDKWYDLYGYTDADEATTKAIDADTGQRIDLNSAKTLSRRLGVTYKELVDIIQTGFINPKLAEMALLYKLGVTVQDVLLYRDHKQLLEEDQSTLSPKDQMLLEEIKAFEERLDNLSVTFQASGFDAKAWMNNALDNNIFDDILTLTDTDGSFNFDQTTLCYSFRQAENDRQADPFAFLKINLFVRLWRKLGWTIEETDCALQAFVPKNTPYDELHLSTSPLKTALIYLSHLKALDEKLHVGKQSRMKLITLWSDLNTKGKNSLYAQLFLTQSMLKSGEVFDDVTKKYMSVFDDPLGQYLSKVSLDTMAERIKFAVSKDNVKLADKINPTAFSDWSQLSIDYDEHREIQSLAYRGVLTNEDKEQLEKLSSSTILESLLGAVKNKAEEFKLIEGHLLALQGGLCLTADDIDCILTDAGQSIEKSKLSLENVSLLYRYGLLANALKLSVQELITLKTLSGINPFKPLLSVPLTKIEDDHPFSQTLRFVEVVEEIKESGLNIEDLDYLLLHQIEDPVGKYRPDKETMLALMKTLAEGIRSIRTEHAVPEDAGAINEETLRQKLGIIFPSDVVDRFLSMMNGTAEFTAIINYVDSKIGLDPEEFTGEPSILHVSYNETKHEQKLTFRGVLFNKKKTALERKYSSELFMKLLDEIQNKQKQFFKKYMQVFFDDYNQLFSGNPPELIKSEKRIELLWALKSHIGAPVLLTEDILKTHLGSVLPPDIADTFLKMLDGDIEYVAVQKNVEPSDKLDQNDFEKLKIDVSYDEENKKQTLTYKGVLLEAKSIVLKEKCPKPLFAKLLDDIQNQARDFYEQNLLGIFSSDDFKMLFTPIHPSLNEKEKEKLREEKDAMLEKALLFYILIVDSSLFSEKSLKDNLKSTRPLEVVPDTFLKMLDGDIEYVAVQKNVVPSDKLDQNDFEKLKIDVSYDEEKKKQTLTYKGVLLEAKSIVLKEKCPKPLFAKLLDDIQNQARDFYEQNLQNFLLDNVFNLLFMVVPTGLNETLKQSIIRKQRTTLIDAFLPFQQQQLIKQFIIQTLTAQTGADPVLMESLLTDARLLRETKTTDNPQPLLNAFTGLVDKDEILFKPDETNSALFEGYLEVPAPGPYRFYIERDKQDTDVELRFDHLPNPLFLSGTEADEMNEISDFLELKPGILYRFSLKLKGRSRGDVRFMVQGENLPKDNLAQQLTFYPLNVIERGEHAWILLNKVLHLTQNLNLNEREMRYLLTHVADFDKLNLSKLPTQESKDTSSEAIELFTLFLHLARYAHVKRNLAGGMDDLIGVFEANEVDNMDEVYKLIANITRRDESTVKDTANVLFTTPAFADELAVQRLWEALQIIERIGVSVTTIVEWTQIVNMSTPEKRFSIARDMKEAIKIHFEPETWLRVARPIFNKLRQYQRDALVAYVMHQQEFTRIEQLYEYFLIDPGMEPVVQTSRIRLAIASVQLFIQRCLLNLEKDVHPSVINSRKWEWMKRYRVWEANRKIFLFPENWLEPEFRDDKTNLFSELEGNLLQGDVSSDLVEDAFLNYLKKLEELARLDIVAMHLEDKADPTLNTLHVIGRTYSQPNKYFYRHYTHQVWTPWEPVTAEIEGDHLAPIVWRNRLYLFWVTFMDKADQAPTTESSNDDCQNETDENEDDPKLSNLKLSKMMTYLKSQVSKKKVEVQLHWSEYLQGEWSTRESGSFSASISKAVDSTFNPKSVFIHVSKEQYENGEERGVYIHLGGDINQAFYLAGRNSIPEPSIREHEPTMPYIHTGVNANRYSARDALTVEFKGRIITENEKTPVYTVETPSILQRGGGYTLLPCNNNITLSAPDANRSTAVAKAIETGFSEIVSLMKPIFYQDNAHTFYIEPNVIERTIEEWNEWVVRTPQPEQEYNHQEWWNNVAVIPATPKDQLSIDLTTTVCRSPESITDVEAGMDWLNNSFTCVFLDGDLIGPRGLMEMNVRDLIESAESLARIQLVNIHTGSEFVSDKTVLTVEKDAFDQAGLVQDAGGINVVGSSGFSSALEQNFTAHKLGFSTNKVDNRSVRRD